MDQTILPQDSNPANASTSAAAEYDPSTTPESKSKNINDLPNELLSIIASFLPRHDQLSLALTCKTLSPAALLSLYKRILVRSEQHMQLLSGFQLAFFTNKTRKPIAENSFKSSLIAKTKTLEICVPAKAFVRGIEGLFPNRHRWEKRVQWSLLRQMKNLRSLQFTYGQDWEEACKIFYGQARHMSHVTLEYTELPTYLPDTLKTFVLKCRTYPCWSFHRVVPLFNMPNLENLELYYGSDPSTDIDKFKPKDTDVRTSLKSLKLIDYCINSNTLSCILKFPRELTYLSICANDHTEWRFDHNVATDRQKYYQIISESSSGSTLQGLRMDLGYGGGLSNTSFWSMKTAPGIYDFPQLRCLDIAQEHIAGFMSWANIGVTRRVRKEQFSPEKVLPKGLEVLKVSRGGVDGGVLRSILKAEKAIVPCLRRVILTTEYRNERMREEVINVFLTSYRHPGEDGLARRFKLIAKKDCRSLGKACANAGVELMVLYEGTPRRHFLGEDLKLAVWEIEQQVRQGPSRNSGS